MCCIPVSTLERYTAEQHPVLSALWKLAKLIEVPSQKHTTKRRKKSLAVSTENIPLHSFKFVDRLSLRYSAENLQVAKFLSLSFTDTYEGYVEAAVECFHIFLHFIHPFYLVLLERDSVHCQASFHFQLSVAAQQPVCLMRLQLDWRHKCTM